MTPYYISYIVMFLLSVNEFCYIGKNNSKAVKYRKRYCAIFAVIWIALLGLRHPTMGVDLDYGSPFGYLERFVLIGQLNLPDAFVKNTHFEHGYVIFNKILSLFGSHYNILLTGCALVALTFFAIWTYRNSDQPFLTSLIYLALPCFLINYSGLRQGLAVSITLVAFEFIKKKKIIPFVLCVLLAATFHSSATIFFIAYPVYWIQWKIIPKKFTTVFPIVVYALRYALFPILSRLYQQNAVVDDSGQITMFVFYCLIYFFAIVLGSDDQEENGFRNLFLIATMIQAMSGIYGGATRLGYYFVVYLSMLLPCVVRYQKQVDNSFVKRKNGVVIYVGIAVAFFVFGLSILQRGGWAKSYPYYFFWNQI